MFLGRVSLFQCVGRAWMRIDFGLSIGLKGMLLTLQMKGETIDAGVKGLCRKIVIRMKLIQLWWWFSNVWSSDQSAWFCKSVEYSYCNLICCLLQKMLDCLMIERWQQTTFSEACSYVCQLNFFNRIVKQCTARRMCHQLLNCSTNSLTISQSFSISLWLLVKKLAGRCVFLFRCQYTE